MAPSPTEGSPKWRHADLLQALREFSPDTSSDDPPEVQQALYLAQRLQKRALELQTPAEAHQQEELDRMLQSPGDKFTLVQMTDQAFRSRKSERAADQLVHILDVQGVPRFFSRLDRALLRGFQSFGNYLPDVAVPLVKEKMQHETANVILPAEPDLLTHFLRQRQASGVRVNVNFLGEAILGEQEAQGRLLTYLQALQNLEIEVVSIKVSTLYSQISTLAEEHTLEILADRLELLYRAALRHEFTRPDGSRAKKLVYLDMEEYRDLHITAEALMRTLSRPGLEDARTGLALQAYIPDSFGVQQRVTQWARGRVASGGAAILLRIVKGANLEMERVEASLAGWPQAPYKTKIETDANYKRMLRFGLQAENLAAAKLGIASHNLFDVTYAMVLAVKHGALDRVQFEMLEGMANHQRRALHEWSNHMLLYAPACKHEDFVHALGYLIRRLDENTGPENFLRHAFRLQVGSQDWHELQDDFRNSVRLIDEVSSAPRRTQDRREPPAGRPWNGADLDSFSNEPDTDFALPHNAAWGREILGTWEQQTAQSPLFAPLVIAGQIIETGRQRRSRHDPSRPEVVVGHHLQGEMEDVETAVAAARKDDGGWRAKTWQERREILQAVAHEIRVARGELIGIAAAEGGKTIFESDPEVSEAVDFVEFYAGAAERLAKLPGVEARGRGVAVVISPWNFPLAIPCGGVASALAAGNTVILKPASDTALTAYRLCECFWEGGISRKTLQFLPCPGSSVGARLARHESVDAVILTGGTETALAMLEQRPNMRLLAETGGKNATIVTSLADRDQAIKNVIHSAFSHSGQKCSATSLLILEVEVHDDPQFRQALCDAVESLNVGAVWEPRTRLGPLIRPPSGVLERGLKELEPGETWVVMPRKVDANPGFFSPGVKWNVRPGSFTHLTELFGPVLAVMKAHDLEHAIELANGTGYGLTAGLESLDDREHAIWKERIIAGNLYINRPTTGAIVLRQPFGGMRKSSFGPGVKAGGPNYPVLLMHFATQPASVKPTPLDDFQLARLAEQPEAEGSDVPPNVPATDKQRLLEAMWSYTEAAEQEFRSEHDHFRLLGQDNVRRYLSVEGLVIRIHPRDSFFETMARLCAARIAGCRPTVSVDPACQMEWLEWAKGEVAAWSPGFSWLVEDEAALANHLRAGEITRVRFTGADRIHEDLFAAAALNGVFLARDPVLPVGRLELLNYLEEQSISVNYHRYGNLGAREGETRRDTL